MVWVRSGAWSIAYSLSRISTSLLLRPVARGRIQRPTRLFAPRTVTTGNHSMTMTTTTSAAATTPQEGEEPLFWNKETNTFRNYDDIPITQTAKIVSISHPNDPDNELLHNTTASRPLPLGCELVQMVSSVKDIDIEQLRDVNVIFCSFMKNAREPLAYLVENLPNLQWIHCRQTGVDFLHSESLTKWGQQQHRNDRSNGRIMTNAKGQFSSTLAEYAMGAMTYFAKDFPRLQRSKASKTWDKYVASMDGIDWFRFIATWLRLTSLLYIYIL
jgi:hypothetical protein